MSVPDYQSLMLPLLKRAVALRQPTTIKQIQPLVAADLGLTAAQLAELLPSGTQGVFHNRLHWAKQYMTRAGLLRSTKFGHFEATDEARKLIFKKKITQLNNSVLEQYQDFVAWRTKGKGKAKDAAVPVPPELVDEATPEEKIEVARKELEASLQAELLDRVRQMDPSEFEALIISLLVRMGYGQGRHELAQVLGGKGDQGVDGVVFQDPLGLDRVYVQAKRYKEIKVGPNDMNSFIGALNIQKANKGLFVTASAFTKQASEHASKSSTHIVLVDGQRLAELMVRHSVGVTVRDTIQIKALDESFFGA